MTESNGVESASPVCYAGERELNVNSSAPSDVKDLRIAIIGAGTLTREPPSLW